MKKITALFLCIGLCITGFSWRPTAPNRLVVHNEHVEFVCKRTHMASHTCHYNFIIDGAHYRYEDIGCKIKKQEKVIEKARNGKIALARDWEIACPEASHKKP